ncbi:putative acetyltransferase [Microbulbifer donghaiensis]|uniref:Putative acetyltransferase n=1 Tax=Microbulbifer donghaiensis TaxID=494016 RepID=A0A1M5GUX3_9GAMM|nr:N-acetyltransferase [Microbulbifer donghaiensis]SHG07500.1 putative acetyltransferase [Microbulbifer donghaiensis]
MDITVRTETKADIDAIDALISAAFQTAEHSSGTEQQIVRALRNSGQLTVSLVAETGGGIVGHVAASPVTVSDGTSGWYGIGPVAVLPAWQGRGIGSQLMKRCLEALRTLDAGGCVLLGSPDYYRRFGFHPQPGLTLPGVPAEYFMALPFQTPIPQGAVSYDSAFSVSP